MKQEIGEGLVNVDREDDKVVITVGSAGAFKSGSAELGKKGKAKLSEISTLLKSITKKLPSKINWIIQVEGHTDNVPFSNQGQISNNWELSTKRATAIISILAENKDISLENLTAAGRSEYSPVDSNDTNEGKAKNRRIEVVLTPKLDEISKLLNKN